MVGFFNNLSELGISEADEHKQIIALYAFIVEFATFAKKDQGLVSHAMIYVHKFLKLNSLLKIDSSYFLATSCIFLAAKIREDNISLKRAVEVFFQLEKSRIPSLNNTVLSDERQEHYGHLIVQYEHSVLEAIEFDFRFELP